MWLRTVAAPQMQWSSMQKKCRLKHTAMYQPAKKRAQCSMTMVKIILILIHFILVWVLCIIGKQKETNLSNKRLCKLCDTTHQSNANRGKRQSVHQSTFCDKGWLNSTQQLLGTAVQNLLTRITHSVAQELGKAHWEINLNNKTLRMLLWDHSHPTFRLIVQGSEGWGESWAWTANWIITPRHV